MKLGFCWPLLLTLYKCFALTEKEIWSFVFHDSTDKWTPYEKNLEKLKCPTSQSLADPQHQMTELTHQQWSPQLLRNTEQWSCHPQAPPQLVRICHPNGLFKTPAEYPLKWAYYWQSTLQSLKTQIKRPTEVFSHSSPNHPLHLGKRHPPSIQPDEEQFILVIPLSKREERLKRK